MKRMLGCLVVVWLVVGRAGSGQGAINTSMLEKIRAEEAAHSQVVPVFETLTTDIGPRLTASPAHLRAVDFVAQSLTSYGLSNVHKEGWKFGRGWTLEKLTVEMVEPRYLPLVAYADGWSAATSGEILASPVFVGGKSAADVQAMGAKLKGAIVMTAPIMTNFVRKDRPQPSDSDYVPGSAGYATSAGRSGAAPGSRAERYTSRRGSRRARRGRTECGGRAQGCRRGRPSQTEHWRARHGVRDRS